MDTMDTMPWPKEITDDDRPIIFFDNFLEMPGDSYDILFNNAEHGPLAMSQGMQHFQNFMLNDFVAEDFDMTEVVHQPYYSKALGEVSRNVQQCILRALDAIESHRVYLPSFEDRVQAVKATAANIKQQDNPNHDPTEKARRLAAAVNWESKNLAMLYGEKDKLEKASVATRKAAGAKIKKYLDFLNQRGLCALSMMSNFELWRQLDAGARAAREVLGDSTSVGPRSLTTEICELPDTQRMLRQSSKFDQEASECPTPAKPTSAHLGTEAPDAATAPAFPAANLPEIADADTQIYPEPKKAATSVVDFPATQQDPLHAEVLMGDHMSVGVPQQGSPKEPAKPVEQECPGHEGEPTATSGLQGPVMPHGVQKPQEESMGSNVSVGVPQQGSPEEPPTVEQECPGHEGSKLASAELITPQDF